MAQNDDSGNNDINPNMIGDFVGDPQEDNQLFKNFSNQERMQEQEQKPITGYLRLQQNQDFEFKKDEDKENMIPEYNQNQQDDILDQFLNNSPKEGKKLSHKKQLTLEQALIIVQQKLSEKSSIENRISGLKFLSQKLRQARPKTDKAYILCNWLDAMKITEKFLHEDSHPQILKNMNSIIKYLYENQKLTEEWIINFAESGLQSSHEQYFKVLQSLLSFLKIQHLECVFDLICHKGNIEDANIGGLLNNIVSNKYFGQQIKGKQIQKNIKVTEQKLSLLEQFENMQNIENRQYWLQVDKKSQQDILIEKQNMKIKQLTLRLYKFLIQIAEKHEKLDKNQKNDKVVFNYYQILNKLVFSKHQFLSNQLCSTLPDLLKTAKINSVWILQTLLKIDFGSNSKHKKNQGKFNFITKLANQNLYEYLLIILAKCRLFNKTVVDKILNILILLSKNYKPLDQVYTQFIWKILGINSRQQKQRQQFFIFVKDILRNQSNFTQEAVYFIFFEILMSLSAEWFSLKILDCLQMLFMRLNQDLKLISYADQTYSIQDPDLVGIDKFWYIYFFSNDSKVTKKCKDILWKLATYNSTSEIKVQLLKQYVEKITKYMSHSPQELRIDFCSKGFDIIDKMMEEVQKKQPNLTQQIEINLMNQCKDALAPKKVTLRFSQKCTLQFLRQQITQAITPANTCIKLLCKGQFLKGQRMTLKDLGIENKNTITVIDDELVAKVKEQKNNQLNNEILKQIAEIFGTEIKHELLKFIVQKMQGQNIQRITDAIMDEDKLARMTSQFQEQNPKNQQIVAIHFDEEQKQINIIDQNISKGPQMEAQKIQPIQGPIDQHQLPKFSNILVSNENYIKKILFCASEGNKKRGWATIKNLPRPSFFISNIQKKCESNNWQVLFPKQQANQMACIYHAHLLKSIFTLDKTKIQRYMLENGGFSYLIDWLRRLPQGSSNIVLEEVTNLLVIVLQENCPALMKFRDRINKKQQKMLLTLLFEQNLLETQSKNDSFVKYEDQTFFNWLINLLLSSQKVNNNSTFPSQNIAEIILCFIIGSNQRRQSVLQLPLNEIFYIIQNHGFVGQYIFLTSMSKILDVNYSEEKKKLYYCRKFLQLANFGFNYQILQQTKSNIVYLYDMIACVLDIINQHTQIETQITLKCIQSIKTQSQFIESQHLIGILQLLKLCLRLCRKNGNIDAKEKIEQKVSQFSEWLFKGYLFDLQKPRKHIRNKAVRKVCYQILQNIAQNNEESAKKLADQIISIQIKQRNKQEDYVDFRSQSYVGLTNLGATCYINSLLQQIYHTKFSKLLLEKGDKDPQHIQRMNQLKHIFMQMCYSIKNSVNPKKLIRNIQFYGQPINTSVQQDASQFLLCLFDYIEGQGCQPEVYQVFGGYLCNQITIIDQQIEEQELVKNNMEHFNSLTIDIKGKKNLQEALAYLIKPQILDGQNRYFCEQLGKKTKASKRCYIEKMPNILILTLKRFQYDLDSHTRHKLNDYFQFPFELDMHKYSASYLRMKEESSPDSKYKLVGILVHSGSAESGHYYSYIKIGEKWFEFNDKIVTQFNIQNNLKTECFGCPQGKKTRSAYMLLYQKVQTMFHGVSLNQIPQSNSYKKQINEQNTIFLKTRLIYDDNYKKLLQQLKELTFEPKLSIYIENIFGKKNNPEQNKRQQPELIHFDADADVEQKNKLIDSYLDL